MSLSHLSEYSSSVDTVRKTKKRAKHGLRSRGMRRRLFTEQLESRHLLTAWLFQGPAPELNGQQDLVNVATADEPVSGNVNAIAPSPTNADLVYVGAVNGGVWKTTNATAANTTWTPLTDNLQSLSISVISFDPTDGTGQTLVAGTGRFSGLGRTGDDLAGIYYTTDGGANWPRSPTLRCRAGWPSPATWSLPPARRSASS